MDQFNSEKLYVVTGDFLNALKSFEKRLYLHDIKRIDANESRDMANYLNYYTDQAFELEKLGQTQSVQT